ncbi:MAG: tRNA/rRNA methyltransferase [Bacteroidales bacterium]
MKVSFILVEPAVPENVGAAARAIKTMGFTDLRLINPCDYLSDKALMLAHGSHDILENAKTYNSLEKAIADIDFTIATTAKQRWVKQNIIDSRELKSFIENKADTINSIAIVFGGEESGLSNHNIELCDRAAAIPIANPYPSLNLGQAVMVFAYTLADIKMKNKDIEKGTLNHGFKPLKKRVVSLLNQVGITNKSLVHGRVLERLTEITKEDVNLLHSVTSKINDKLNSNK